MLSHARVLCTHAQTADVWSCGVMLYVMLAGCYPFERPEDKHDNQRLQKMIQRILKVDYKPPPHLKLSADCQDLMSKILTADPAKRITIDGIFHHPWYTKNLPPGVIEMNKRPPPTPAGMQTVEQVKLILAEARKAQGNALGAGIETDEYLNDAMDGLADDEALDY